MILDDFLTTVEQSAGVAPWYIVLVSLPKDCPGLPTEKFVHRISTVCLTRIQEKVPRILHTLRANDWRHSMTGFRGQSSKDGQYACESHPACSGDLDASSEGWGVRQDPPVSTWHVPTPADTWDEKWVSTMVHRGQEFILLLVVDVYDHRGNKVQPLNWAQSELMIIYAQRDTVASHSSRPVYNVLRFLTIIKKQWISG